MKYITVREASEKWNISERRICILCRDGRIPGAIKRAKIWVIPAQTDKPADKRMKNLDSGINPIQLLVNGEYYLEHYSNILSDEELQFCQMANMYYEGRLESAFELASHLINTCRDTELMMVALHEYMLIASDLGYPEELESASLKLKSMTKENPDNTVAQLLAEDLNISEMVMTMSGEESQEVKCFLLLIYLRQKVTLMLRHGDPLGDIITLEMICREIEQYECNAYQAYIHVIFAVFYNLTGNTEYCNRHLDDALQIILPRKWFTPLAEYSLPFSIEQLNGIDADDCNKIRSLSNKIRSNYIKMGVINVMPTGSMKHQVTKIRIAYQIAMNKTNREIMEELGLSEYMLKQHISDIYATTGSTSRKEIREYVLSNIIL